jgi:hypothetical protein
MKVAIIVISCVLVLFGAATATCVWLINTGDKGGVKTANEVRPYAREYLAQHRILNSTEKLLCYYDATLTVDGTEAAMVTTERVLYHNHGHTTAIPLVDVTDVAHRDEGIIGDIITVTAGSGEIMKITIAPLNDGATFLDVLRKQVDRVRDAKPAPASAPAPGPTPNAPTPG